MLEDCLNIFLPQIFLCFFAFILLFFACLSPKFYKYAIWISETGIIITAIALYFTKTTQECTGFNNSILSNSYTQTINFVILLCGFLIILLSRNITIQQKQNSCTIQALFLFAILGAINTVSANDFLTLFVSIELLNFSIYFIVSAPKGYYSKEVAFKYLITNTIAIGIFLFGISYLYGITSSINLTEIKNYIPNNEQYFLYSCSIILIFVGLISKLGVFPFANWIISVYKGTESSILAFLSTISELAIFGIIFRLFSLLLNKSSDVICILIIFPVITAIWANFYAIKEKNIKAIFACSSSANASYILAVACINSTYNFSATIFYLICYVFMNISIFSFLNIAEFNKLDLNVENYKKLFYDNNIIIIAYVITVIALAGMPITSGFISKIYIFSGFIQSGINFYPILSIILLLTILALYYYLRIIYPLLFSASIFYFSGKYGDSIKLKSTIVQKFVLIFCTIVTIYIGICPNKLITLSKSIAKIIS